jgi:restriction system protein
MARRRNKDLDIATGVAQLVALLILGAMFAPPVRQALLGLGTIFVGLIILAGLVGLAALVLRRARRPNVAQNCTVSPQVMMPPSSPPANEANPPRSTADLARQLRNIDWFQFEKIVGLTFRKLGYSVTTRGGANPDGGIDLIIEKDGQRTAIQCKHWKTWKVGASDVRELVGAITHAEIQKGIIVTIRGYTREAKQLAEEDGIEIVNELGLTRMLEATDARFDSEMLAILKNTQKFCPKCGAEMELRTATKGRNPGEQFWGCSNYPKRRCRGSLPYHPSDRGVGLSSSSQP